MTNDDVEFIAKIGLIYLLCFTSLLILTLLLGGSDLAPLTPCNKQYSNYCKNRLNLFCILIVSCMVVVHASSSTVQSCFIPLLLLLVKITIFSLHWLAFQTSQLAFVIIWQMILAIRITNWFKLFCIWILLLVCMYCQQLCNHVSCLWSLSLLCKPAAVAASSQNELSISIVAGETNKKEKNSLVLLSF